MESVKLARPGRHYASLLSSPRGSGSGRENKPEARSPVHLCAHRACVICICVLAKALRGYAGGRLGLWEDVIHAGMDPGVFRVHLLSLQPYSCLSVCLAVTMRN